MNVTMKLIAWTCILSTALWGCTSTTLVNPEGKNADKLYDGDIEIVVTKDGTKYEFEDSQEVTINAGVIRGISGGKAVAIPLAEISKVYVRESDTVLTILAGVGVVAIIGFVVVGSALSDCHKDFESLKK